MRDSVGPAGWYAFCGVYLALPETQRARSSPQKLAHYRRIRRLPASIGDELDRRGAPLHVMRWIAWAGAAPERERRHAVAIGHHGRTGRWPTWRTLHQVDAEIAPRDGGARGVESSR